MRPKGSELAARSPTVPRGRGARLGAVVAWALSPGLLPLLVACGGTDGSPRVVAAAEVVCRDCSVLFVVSDALRADALGCYGGEAATPNLDRLARDGALFERAYAAAPWTLPASVSMFTGRYPSSYLTGERHGYPLFYVGDHERLVGELLRGEGYEVVHRLDSPVPLKTNVLQGFEELPSGRSRNRLFRFAVDTILGWEDTLPVRWATRPPKKFFALRWILDPHAPYDPPEELRQSIDLSELPLEREPEFYSALTHYARRWQLGSKTLELELSKAEREYLRQLYYREVESVDRRLGVILDFLEKRRLLDGTLVVFTSDHGEEFADHGGYNHGHTYYEEMLRIPLIIAGPGIAAGQQIATEVSHIDLVPTLVDVLGIAHPGGFHGRSLRPLMTVSGDRFEERYLYAEGGPGEAVMKQGRKLIRSPLGGGKEALALYDLVKDPREIRNLSGLEPEIVLALRAQLMEFRRVTLEWASKNMEALDSASLEAAQEETVEELRALGYIQ